MREQRTSLISLCVDCNTVVGRALGTVLALFIPPFMYLLFFHHSSSNILARFVKVSVSARFDH